MKRSMGLGLLALSLIAGCGRESDPPAAESSPRVRPEPVVVYADRPGEAVLRPVFAQFTNATGIPVTIREADGEKNLRDVLSNKGAPPADVLFADNVADIWIAGDEGALRQLGAASGIGSFPDPFRDPDGQWLALGIDPLVIAYGQGVEVEQGADYAILGEERFKGKLCLTVSSRPGSRALIAYYIDERGERPAEILARRWMANLARPPMHSPVEILAALADGSCGVSIVPASSLANVAGLKTVALGNPVNVAFGAGVARHARYPETAAEVLAWMAGKKGQAIFADATGTRSAYAAADTAAQPFSKTGWLDEEARLLAERASWR